MKKKTLIVLSGIFVLILGICSYFWFNKDNKTQIYENEKGKVNEQVVGSNWLSMMYETGPGTGEYTESKSSLWPEDGYIFNENLSGCENGGELSWNNELNAVTLHSNKSDACYVYFDLIPPTFADTCRDTGSNTLACYISTQYTNGNNGLYYHDSNLVNGAGDNSYRYSGVNPNNYVCFGSNASVCPSDNLYRIIGVFDGQVKLIKADYAQTNLLGINGDYSSSSYSEQWGSSNNYKGSISQSLVPIYYWNNNTNNNTWSTSYLNSINLNTNYINNIENTWSNLIANHTWKVGGMTYSNGTSTPSTAYNYEVGVNSSSTTYSAKIGLMYASDYGFAASPENWTTDMYSYNTSTNRDNNWLFMGLVEWTISCYSDTSNTVFYVADFGCLYGLDVSYYGGAAARPTFYLNSDVVYSSGSGTESDPIRLVV